ncbi:MAG: tetratricopeptide repeat protein, partial [Chloroflexota bacterium]
MIELLLVAEQLFDDGAYDQAAVLFEQVSQADPRNAIAVAGLARVALARGDRDRAFEEARRALAIDPEEVDAQRLIGELIASAEARDEEAGVVQAAPAVAEPEADAGPEADAEAVAAESEPEPEAGAEPGAESEAEAEAESEAEA